MGWERRPQAEAQMGNGVLLATFDSFGEVEQLFSPHIDALQSHLGIFQTSVIIPSAQHHAPQLVRLRPDLFQIRLRLLPGTQVLEAEYHLRSGPLRLVRKLGIHPTEPLILDCWQILDDTAGLLHESAPWMGNSTSAHCSLFHPKLNGLVHHRGRRWLGVIVKGDVQWARVSHLSDHDRYRLWGGEKIDCPMGPQELSGFPGGAVRGTWEQVVQGPATWGALAVGPLREIEMIYICAESEHHLARLLGLVHQIPTERYFQMIESMVERRHKPALPILDQISNPSVRGLCERSIDVLHALQDARSGALMAAAEVDPHSRVSGGYGYSWPRDGVYLAEALDEFGFRDRVERYFDFVADTQDTSGAWWQRYLASGHAGPSWGRIQIDEPATVLVGAWHHYRRTRDLFWLEKIWPTLKKGLEFLEAFHAPEHSMGLPSHDLWEERMGVHAYSLGGVVQAFLAGACMARELSDQEKKTRYYQVSRTLRGVLNSHFFPDHAPIRRSFVVNSGDYLGGGGYWDEAADSSLLGLITPFQLFRPRDLQAQRILAQVRRLECPGVGGVFRYERDTYRGGNPWVLNTLWRAGVELRFGHLNEAREGFLWAHSKQTPLGMLAEQVHRESGFPFWVIPLGWSHAMYLCFVREVLARGRQDQIWSSFEPARTGILSND